MDSEKAGGRLRSLARVLLHLADVADELGDTLGALDADALAEARTRRQGRERQRRVRSRLAEAVEKVAAAVEQKAKKRAA